MNVKVWDCRHAQDPLPPMHGRLPHARVLPWAESTPSPSPSLLQTLNLARMHTPHPPFTPPQANDVQLCGRILVFIVRLYPLSDKSGLNLQGAINAALPLPLDEVRGEGWQWCGVVCTGGGGWSARRPPSGQSHGSVRLISILPPDLSHFFLSLFTPPQVGPDDLDSVGQPIDGKLYATFWGLQAAFKVEGVMVYRGVGHGGEAKGEGRGEGGMTSCTPPSGAGSRRRRQGIRLRDQLSH